MTYEFSSEQRYAMLINDGFKSPKRITITIPHSTYEYLLKRSDYEGRSLSNLAAFLLESKQEGNPRRQRISLLGKPTKDGVGNERNESHCGGGARINSIPAQEFEH